MPVSRLQLSISRATPKNADLATLHALNMDTVSKYLPYTSQVWFDSIGLFYAKALQPMIGNSRPTRIFAN
jgi:hypothetical protein